MSKKFDVVIGNPPYQEEAQGGGTRDTPVYHLFMDAAYEVGKKVVLITPARFLFNAGFTPKAWNEKMLADPHLTVAHYVPDSDELFPGTDHQGRHRRHLPRRGPRRRAHRHVHEVPRAQHDPAQGASSRASPPSSSRTSRVRARTATPTSCTRTTLRRARCDPQGNAALVNTNAFEQFSFLYHDEKPSDGNEYVRVLGLIKNKRASRWIRSEYITGPESFDKYKVAVPAANGSGSTTDFFGVALNNPTVRRARGRGHTDVHHHRLVRRPRPRRRRA